MQNKMWKKFEKLTVKCYNNMGGVEEDGSCWLQAFELLKEIVRNERQKNPGFAPQLENLDDVTDYEYDIQGWLEDCLDMIDMREEHETLLKMCEDLLKMFGWPEYTGSDVKLRKAGVLSELGRKSEAVKYCSEWILKEPENIVAATAGVYAFIGTKEFQAAEELVDRFLINKSECTEENDIMFTAASRLYEITGKKKEKKQIDKAIKNYEKYLEEYFENSSWDSDDEDWDVFEQPFD